MKLKGMLGKHDTPPSLPLFQPTQNKFKAPLYIICIRKVSKAQARSD